MYTKEFELQYQRDEKSAIENIPNWIAKGQYYLFPERFASWEINVNACAKGVFHGGEIDAALEIIAKLEGGASIQEAKELLALQGHSAVSLALVRNLVFSFSSLGPEFWEATVIGKITSEGQKKLNAKKMENRELAKKHGKILKDPKTSEDLEVKKDSPQIQMGVDKIDSMEAASHFYRGEDLLEESIKKEHEQDILGTPKV